MNLEEPESRRQATALVDQKVDAEKEDVVEGHVGEYLFFQIFFS